MPCTAQTTLQRVGNPDPQHAGEALRTRASQTRSAPATSLRGELPQRHSTGQPSAAKRTRFNLASARFVSRDPNRQAPKPSGRTDVHRGSRRPPSRPPARGLHCRHCCAIYLHAPSRSLSGPGGRVPATHRLGSSAETAGFPKLRAERPPARHSSPRPSPSRKLRHRPPRRPARPPPRMAADGTRSQHRGERSHHTSKQRPRKRKRKGRASSEVKYDCAGQEVCQGRRRVAGCAAMLYGSGRAGLAFAGRLP